MFTKFQFTAKSSLPRKSVVWCTDCLKMTLADDLYNKPQTKPYKCLYCDCFGWFVILCTNQQLLSCVDSQFTYPHVFVGRLDQAVNQSFMHKLSCISGRAENDLRKDFMNNDCYNLFAHSKNSLLFVLKMSLILSFSHFCSSPYHTFCPGLA